MVPVAASTSLSITRDTPRRCAGIVLRRHAHFQLPVGAETPDGRKLLFGYAEVHKNRRDLVDHHQRHVVHLHQVARVYQQVPGATRNGRADLAIAQVELGPVHRRLVAGERRARAFDAGLRGLCGGARDVGVGARLVGLRLRSQPALLQLRLQSRVAIGVLGRAESRASVASAWAIWARSRSTLASAWRSASSYGRGSMVNSRSPWATFCPSVKAVRTSSPAICDFTCTMADASTVPTTRSWVGTDSSLALATETGTAGGPPMGRACSRLHPLSASRHALKIRIWICRTDHSPIYEV